VRVPATAVEIQGRIWRGMAHGCTIRYLSGSDLSKRPYCLKYPGSPGGSFLGAVAHIERHLVSASDFP